MQIHKNGRKERWGEPVTSGGAPPLQRQEEKEPSRAPGPRSCRRKIQSHVSSLYRYVSKYQASSKRKQNHALTEKDSDGHSGHSLGSIILPGTGSCWTWSGMAQTTSAEGHPGEEGTLIRYGFKHEPHTSVSPF